MSHVSGVETGPTGEGESLKPIYKNIIFTLEKLIILCKLRKNTEH